MVWFKKRNMEALRYSHFCLTYSTYFNLNIYWVPGTVHTLRLQRWMGLDCCSRATCSLVEDVQSNERDQRIKQETGGTLWIYYHCLWLLGEWKKLFLKIKMVSKLLVMCFSSKHTENGCSEQYHRSHLYLSPKQDFKK